MDAETRTLIRHLPPARKRSVRESLQAIASEPTLGKALQEELGGLFSYRVGGFRIVYSVDAAKRRVHFVALGPRRTIYAEVEMELRRR